VNNKPTNFLIGIAGQKRAGKDTTCELITNLLKTHYEVRRVAFGDEVKREVSKATGVSLEDIEEHKEFFRPLLKFWGTELRRLWFNCPDYWLNFAREEILSEVAATPEKPKVFIITDIRNPNELFFLSEFNFNSASIYIERYKRDRQDLHSSESSVTKEGCDFAIENVGSLQQLEDKVREILIINNLL